MYYKIYHTPVALSAVIHSKNNNMIHAALLWVQPEEVGHMNY